MDFFFVAKNQVGRIAILAAAAVACVLTTQKIGYSNLIDTIVQLNCNK